MEWTRITDRLSVTAQMTEADIADAGARGIRLIINNRPDGEAADQPPGDQLAAAAARAGVSYRHIPVTPGVTPAPATIAAFADTVAAADGPVLAFCRTGARSTQLARLAESARPPMQTPDAYDVVVVGGGAGGIATAASILRRRPSLRIAIVEPSDRHHYQPGWTMVGAGVFSVEATGRPMASVMPRGVDWVRDAVATFDPERDSVTTATGRTLRYRALVVAPGIMLDWDAIDGLREALGRHGVTSNYDRSTAPYTWQLVQDLRDGVALFTQPPMPIKCAGAPQKAMYLSCSEWERRGVLGDIRVGFHNAGAVLFGVKDYVPALERYIARYGVDLRLGSTLIAVDGPARRATFRTADGDVTQSFDMLHVTPPQRAPRVIADSPLGDAAGFVDCDPATLRHVRYPMVFGLGDGGATPNAKTAAAVRKQAPVVAANLLAALDGKPPVAGYDGYGSCPLTVERGRIVLAEFGYGGTLLPSFPSWLIDGTQPSRLSWQLKARALPFVYWNAMLKGREWMAAPAPLADTAS